MKEKELYWCGCMFKGYWDKDIKSKYFFLFILYPYLRIKFYVILPFIIFNSTFLWKCYKNLPLSFHFCEVSIFEWKLWSRNFLSDDEFWVLLKYFKLRNVKHLLDFLLLLIFEGRDNGVILLENWRTLKNNFYFKKMSFTFLWRSFTFTVRLY